MSRRSRLPAIVATIASLVGLVLWVAARSPRGASVGHAAPAHDEPPALLRLAWTPGRAYVYALHAQTKESARLGDGRAAQTVDGELRLDGELVVRCYSQDAETYELGVSLRALDGASLVVGGAQVIADARDLEGKEVVLDVDARGHVARTRVRGADPATSKLVLRSVAALLRVSLPEEATSTWSADEPTLLGQAQASYRIDGGRAFVRTHPAYRSLSALREGTEARAARIAGEDRVALAEDGALGAVRIAEHVAVEDHGDALLVADAAVDLARTSVESFAARPVADADLSEREVAKAPRSEASRRATLEGLAAGLTLDRLESVVATFGAGVRPEPGFLTSAAALLQLEPAYAAELVHLFERADTNGPMRGMICDLLASAGTHAAQAALRDVLSSDAARHDAKLYPALVQRLAFVARPEPETLGFAYGVYASNAGGATHTAAAYALGSSIGALARSGDRAQVATYTARLRLDLAKASKPEERATVLAALGNAGLPENVAVIRRFAEDPNASVRRESAFALRKSDVPDAHATLMDLLGDGDASVAGAALESIGEARLDDARMNEIASLATTHALAGELNEGLLTLAASHPDAHDAAVALARAVLASSQDARTQARARMILERLGAG